MDGVARTAYYCCGVRAADAGSPAPICGDDLALRFMNAEARETYQRFAPLARANSANAARHRIIDDLLRERLALDPDRHVLLLGAGFDTRAFRLAGGHWLELDHPAIIERKEECLPAAQAPNDLRRAAIDFERDRLADKLAPWAGKTGVVVVLEGVSMYLTPEQLQATTRTLHRLFPDHVLVCDLIDAVFVRRYSRALRQRLNELGAAFAPPEKDPAALLASFGYRRVADWSIVGQALDLGAAPAPLRWFFHAFLHALRDGYRVYCFETVDASPG